MKFKITTCNKENQKMSKPQPPAEGACCDSGCSPCVWDTYYANLQAWRIEIARQKTLEASADTKDNK